MKLFLISKPQVSLTVMVFLKIKQALKNRQQQKKRKSSDDEASENLNKNIIEEKAKDNQQIKFLCQKTIKYVNINSNKTLKQEEKKLQKIFLFH